MRRRRPSALYTVLDEESLLGGVDRAEHPHPLADRSSAATVPEEWDDWSPDPEDWTADGHPEERCNVEYDADSGSASDEQGGGPRPSVPGRHLSADRRRWLTLGFVVALGLLLLAARELGTVLDVAGQRSSRRPANAGATADAVSAASPGLRSSAGGAPARPAAQLPDRRVRAGDTADAARRSRPQPPSAPGRAWRQAKDPARGPAVESGHPTRLAARNPTPVTSRPFGEARRGGARRSSKPLPSLSPDQEFGFER